MDFADWGYLLVGPRYEVVETPLWEEVDEVLGFVAGPDEPERRPIASVLGPGVADDGHHGCPPLRLPPNGPTASALLPGLGVGGLPALPQVQTYPTVQQEQS